MTETIQQKLARIRAEKAGTPSTTSKQLIPATTIAAAQVVEQQIKEQSTSNSNVATTSDTTSTETLPTLIADPLETIVGFDYHKFNGLLSRFAVELEKKAPGIPNYLKEIHNNLNQYPEIVHLLNDTQLNLICSGYFHYTDVKMAEVVVKSKKGKVSVDEAATLFG